jgi:hypothetical protein
MAFDNSLNPLTFRHTLTSLRVWGLQSVASKAIEAKLMPVAWTAMMTDEVAAPGRVPETWLGGPGEKFRLAEEGAAMLLRMQAWIAATAFHIDGCAGAPPLQNARVTRVLRVENKAQWQIFDGHRAKLREARVKWSEAARDMLKMRLITHQPLPELGGMCVDAGELRLFHGTGEAMAQKIAEHGFNINGSDLDGLFGGGCYFADCSCKAHQYSFKKAEDVELVLLVCRVAMGWPYFITEQLKRARQPPDNQLTGRPFDSVVAEKDQANFGRQLHNEFVVYHDGQVYPEYLVYYELG